MPTPADDETRDRRILRRRKADPSLTAAEIADRVGCSTAEVRRVLDRTDTLRDVRIELAKVYETYESADADDEPRAAAAPDWFERVAPVASALVAGALGGFLLATPGFPASAAIERGALAVCGLVVGAVGVGFARRARRRGFDDALAWLLRASDRTADAADGSADPAPSDPEPSMRRRVAPNRRCGLCGARVAGGGGSPGSVPRPPSAAPAEGTETPGDAVYCADCREVVGRDSGESAP